MPSMRAEPCIAEVRIGICQPSQERALTPMRAAARRREGRQSPARPPPRRRRIRARHAAATSSRAQPTSLLVSPAMAETTTATWLPRSTSASPRSRHGGCGPDRPPRCRRISSQSWPSTGPFARPCVQAIHRRHIAHAQRRNRSHDRNLIHRRGRSREVLRAGGGMVGSQPANSRRCTSSIPCGSGFIRDTAAAHFGRDPKSLRPFEGLDPARYRLRRRTAVRADGAAGICGDGRRCFGAEHRNGARPMRAASGVAIDYRATTAEALAAEGADLRCRARTWKWSSMSRTSVPISRPVPA